MLSPAVVRCPLLLAVLLLLVAPATALAQGESQLEDAPVQTDAHELANPLDEEFKERKEEVVELPGEEVAEPEAPPAEEPPEEPEEEPVLISLPRFLERGRLDVRFRSYYLYGKQIDSSRREAWTYGGWVRYRTPWFAERLTMGTALYTSQSIHAPSGRGGTLLLLPRQRSFTVVGEAYLKLRPRRGHEISLYRQRYNLPYVNRRDNRMVPNTFEGYSLTGRLSGDEPLPSMSYFAGYISRIKDRDSDRFIPMGEEASLVDDPKRGMALLGGQFKASEDLSFGATAYRIPDVLQWFYLLVDQRFQISGELQGRFALHHTDQRSIGDDLWTGSSFHTRSTAAGLALSYRAAAVTLAFQSTAREERIRSPFGSRPSPLSKMVRSFDRAGQQAWTAGLAYHFGPVVGWKGLSAAASYARGIAAHEPDGARRPDESELDLTVDYTFKSGPLTGLWLRVRGAFIHEQGGQSQNQLRVILNYDLPLGDVRRRIRAGLDPVLGPVPQPEGE